MRGMRGRLLGALMGVAAALGAAPSALALPDGRVYEMVSPPEKNGGEVQPIGQLDTAALASPTGDRFLFTSPLAFAGATGVGTNNGYVAAAGLPSWTTSSLSLPMTAPTTGSQLQPVALQSEDLTRFVVLSNTDPATHTRTSGVNGYLVDQLAGTRRLVTPPPAVGTGDYLSENGVTTHATFRGIFRDATPDLSHILVYTSLQLTSDAPATGTKSYVIDTETVTPELVSVLPGEVPTAISTGTIATSQAGIVGRAFSRADNLISDGGSRVYFGVSGAGVAGLYVRVNGTQSVQVNADEKAVPTVTSGSARMLEITPDGRYAFFRTNQALVDADTGSGYDIYRFDLEAPAGDRLTLVTVDSEPADGATGIGSSDANGSLGISEDGSGIYFMTEGQQLVAGGPTTAGTRKLYAWRAGTLKFIAELAVATPDVAGLVADALPRQTSVSPDGSVLAFASASVLPTRNEPGEPQVWVYDADESTALAPDLECASCHPELAVTPEVATLRPETQHFAPTARPRWVLNSGEVFFTSSTALVPDDENGLPDAYSYRSDRGAQLISTGRSDADSNLLDVTPDGTSVFFQTREPLVGWDVDVKYDVYAAKIGGGLPEPGTPPEPCAGDDCQGPPGTLPGPIAPGSSGFSGEGDAKPVRTPARVTAPARRSVRGAAVRIRVRVSGPGRVTVGGQRVRSATRKASDAGAVTVVARLRPAARKALRSGKAKIATRVRVTYQPRDRGPVSRIVRVTFKAAR